MLFLIPLVLLVHLILLLNTRFTLWPEMVVYPYLINNGYFLYRDIINPYPPLLTSFLALFSRIFGYQPLPYQILTWLVVMATDLLIFQISKKIFKKPYLALISLLFFATLSLPFSVNGLWFDLIQTPLILVAFFYFYKFLQKANGGFDNLFWAMLSLSAAFFIKQQVILLFPWFLAVTIFKFRRRTDVLIKLPLLFVPSLILLIGYMMIFWQQKTLADFLFWTIHFPFVISPKMPGYLMLPTIHQLAIVTFLFLLFTPIFLTRKQGSELILATALILLLFTYPRFDYFHLIPSIAILSLMFGENIKVVFGTKMIAQVLLILSLISLTVFTTRFFIKNWHQEIRFFEKSIIEAAISFGEMSKRADRVYVQNGPDQILPLSKRLPIKPWADEFPWYLEIEGIQERIVRSLQVQRPKYLIYKPYDSGPKYQIGAYQPQKITNYLEENYQNLIQISDTLILKVRK